MAGQGSGGRVAYFGPAAALAALLDTILISSNSMAKCSASRTFYTCVVDKLGKFATETKVGFRRNIIIIT